MTWTGCGQSPDPAPKRHQFYASVNPEQHSEDVDKFVQLINDVKWQTNDAAKAIEVIASNVQNAPITKEKYSHRKHPHISRKKESHKEPYTIDPNFVTNYGIGRASYKDIRNETYKNGDIYFLIGNLEDDMGREEWERYYTIAVWLSKKRFRPILNPIAQIIDVQEAVQNEYTSAIIWSSHGGRKTGQLKDHLKIKLPFNIFKQHAGARLKHFVLSNCNGALTIKSYYFPPGARMHYWKGNTDSDDLFKYLFSQVWDQNLMTDLGIQSLKNK